jgi:hypothetical protein
MCLFLDIIKTNKHYSCKYKKGSDVNKFFSNKIRVIPNKLKINKGHKKPRVNSPCQIRIASFSCIQKGISLTQLPYREPAARGLL